MTTAGEILRHPRRFILSIIYPFIFEKRFGGDTWP
jgi:hypothetical protein